MGHLVVNKLSKPMFTSYDVNSAPNEYIAKTRESMPVFAWTIRNEKDLEKRAPTPTISFSRIFLLTF